MMDYTQCKSYMWDVPKSTAYHKTPVTELRIMVHGSVAQRVEIWPVLTLLGTSVRAV